ncbi:MAG TPA: hypothetical protein VFL16_11580 [Steroidobacteraceae bacterium]|nr:hypothetical protein [Steroidobacteraceae bacterium]
MTNQSANIAELLNRECDCSPTDLGSLHARLDDSLRHRGSRIPLLESHPHLFSATPVFIDPAHVNEMARVIASVDTVVQLPRYRDAVLSTAPGIARMDRKSSGVFMGFDFHMSPTGPKLIEINTNAGGALLNIELHRAQKSCCGVADEYLASRPSASDLENEVVSMFEREWIAARGSERLRTIAICDTAPREQFLYPEFQLAKMLFESRGYVAHIVDPSEFEVNADKLELNGERIDLVYNRLTDFYFDDPDSRAIKTAYERDLAVVTPHPQGHALYSSKTNLALLSDVNELRRLGAAQQVADTLLRGIPQTREVSGCEDAWWTDRKSWFFKPRNGFGSRGTYRGDKMTRRVFAEVMRGGYMAQQLTPASERLRTVYGQREAYKLDVRCYVYDGKVQLMAARLYQGQTTNFRTAGGGFAPIYVVGDDGWSAARYAAR